MLLWLGLVVLALVVAGAIAVLADREPAATPPLPDIALDAWAPYWALDASVPTLAERVGSLREVSPFWFNALGAATIHADTNASVALTDQFMQIARDADVAIVASIVDAMPAGAMAAVLADPVSRTTHVDTIVRFADNGDFDGIDLDYEQFAFADGRDTWGATRPNWVAFVSELAARLHADGRTLTVSIPPVYDTTQTADAGYWVYDYAGIVDHVDRIRIMAYDYSVETPGPIAPLDWVESAIQGAIAATGSPDKLVLGLPAFGRNWPLSTRGVCPQGQLQGRTNVSSRSVDELIERRSATPVLDPSTSEWSFDYDLDVTDGTTSCVQTRRVHYVDGDGIAARMDLARQYRLGGVALWALGFDDQAVWDAILPTVADPTRVDASTPELVSSLD